MTMPKDLILVRHGQSEGNLVIKVLESQNLIISEEYYNRHTAHWRLTTQGVSQAKIAGEWLKDNMDLNFDRYYVSDYVRAKETAGHLGLPNAEWLINIYLGERNWGILDRFNAEQREKEYALDLLVKKIHPFYWTPPRGESMSQLCLRLQRVLETLHRECSEKRVIMVCHGEVMWGFRVILERMPIDKYLQLDESTNPFDRIHTCQIIHYSRKNPQTNEISPYLSWMRSICPTDLSLSTNKWQEIIRPKFTNKQLLKHAEKFPRIIDNEEVENVRKN